MNWEEKYNALAELVDGYRRERDEAREEVERLRAEAAPMNEHFNAGYRDGYRDAYRRDAEAMREACVNVVLTELSDPWYSDELLQPMRALSITEDKP